MYQGDDIHEEFRDMLINIINCSEEGKNYYPEGLDQFSDDKLISDFFQSINTHAEKMLEIFDETANY